MHSSLHPNVSQHHHQSHLQMSFTSVSAYPHLQSTHQHHHPQFHHATAIHHPQPMPFTPIVHHHHAHPLAPTNHQRLDHNKMSAFEFPNHQNELYKTHYHHSPSPTQTIKTVSSIEPSSEGMSSPPLIVDNVPSTPPPPLICSGINATNNAEHSIESTNKVYPLPPTPTIGPPQHNGLLDILMNPDKCQEFIQYQVHNSMMFPTLPPPPVTPHVSPLEVRLPTWEVLQETTARLLFMAVRWVRCLVPFQTLSKNDQQLLLQVSKII